MGLRFNNRPVGLESIDDRCHEFGGNVHTVSSVCHDAYK